MRKREEGISKDEREVVDGERVGEGERGRAREREELWKGEGNDRRECRGCF